MSNKLGEKIKEIRLENGMSQEEFAKELGYTSKSTITKLEKGVNDISYDKLQLLIRKFDLEVNELFDNLAKDMGSKVISEDRTERVELTVLCLVEDGNKILLQNRVKKDWQGYTLPGGHVERDESFVDAVIREMKEETGLDVFNIEPRGFIEWNEFGDDVRHLAMLYRTKHYKGTPKSSSEGQIFFIKEEDIKKHPLSNDFMKIYEKLKD